MKKPLGVGESVTTHLFVGSVEERYEISTAIHKAALPGKAFLSVLGLEGDECADTDHHGGLDRALHHYPSEHYQFWQNKYPDLCRDWVVSGMGENISTYGMLEGDVFIGDRYQFGDAVIEVSQPRSPCFKLNRRWQIESLSITMQDLGHCGWLYRVIQPGAVEVDAKLTLIHREAEGMSVQEVCSIFFGDPLNRDGLLRLAKQKALSDSWQEKVLMRLQTQQVEDWSYRLLGRYEDNFRS